MQKVNDANILQHTMLNFRDLDVLQEVQEEWNKIETSNSLTPYM